MSERLALQPERAEGRAQASDEELVRLIRQGEKELFAHLLRRYERNVYRIVQGILSISAGGRNDYL